ncbi:MAG: fructose PTS transporter subunit IIA [Halapricum sp.]
MDKETVDRVISPDLVSLEEPPADKEAVIEHLLDLAVDAGRIDDREQALEDLLAREEETSTGVGKGIGIPHAKTAGASEPTVAFTRSSEGVDFGAPDGEPATLLFMILVPVAGSDEHLEILSSLSRALMHDEVREDLHTAGSPKEVTTVLTNAIT